MKNLLLILLSLILYSCSTGPTLSESEAVLAARAISNNDTLAYDELSMYNWLERVDSMYYYASEMANRNEYPQAFFDVFYCLTDKTYTDLQHLELSKKEEAILYLRKAFELGNEDAINQLSEYAKNDTVSYQMVMKVNYDN